jgi:hypothetical protein
LLRNATVIRGSPSKRSVDCHLPSARSSSMA